MRRTVVLVALLTACATPAQSPGSPDVGPVDTGVTDAGDAGSSPPDSAPADAAADAGAAPDGSDVAAPDASDVTAVDSASSDATPVDTSAPDTSAPDTSASDTNAPDTSAPDVGSQDGGAPDAAPSLTTLVLHHPNAAQLRLRGDKAPLSWTQSLTPAQVSGDTATFTLPISAGVLRVKALELHQGKERWAIGPNHVVQPGAVRHVYPFFAPESAKLVRKDITVTGPGGASRTVRLLLPPGYAENTSASYPLLLMFDGQNLFDDATAAFGVSWKVQDAVAKAWSAGELTEIVVAGVDNGGAKRIAEYTPWADAKYAGSGQGAKTLDWLEKTVIPALEKGYRLAPGRESRTLAGSSLGGLMSLYGLLARPATYSGALALSGSWWWAGDKTVSWAPAKVPAALPAAVWLDAGTSKDGADAMQALAKALATPMAQPGGALKSQLYKGAGHNEASWKARFGDPLRFRFDPGDREPAF